MPRCHISLGGNSGPVAATFDQALARLQNESDIRVVAVSRYHKTAPVGDEAGAGFLNAAAELETALDPLHLLDKLQSVERDLGRTRSTHWGPRTVDLDLLFYELQIIDSPRLIVPHPAAWYRRFVLDPLVEIAPRFVHPVKEADLATLRDRLLARPLRVSLAGSSSENKTELIRWLSPSFAAVEFSDSDTAAASASDRLGDRPIEPALIFWLGPPSGITEPRLSGPENAAPAVSDFERLPPLPRIDATTGPQPVHDFVRYVIQSALG
jgi:2-amino-4-hydroxy-6-hydroxymethyldihydropteridine diphosphokinase